MAITQPVLLSNILHNICQAVPAQHITLHSNHVRFNLNHVSFWLWQESSSLFCLDMLLCTSQHPSVQKAIISLMIANYHVTHQLSEQGIFGLKPNTQEDPVSLMMMHRFEDKQLQFINWKSFLTQLTDEHHRFLSQL